MNICVRTILFSLFLTCSVILINLPNVSFSSSPEFAEQVITDDETDWINMKTRQILQNEYRVPDLTSIDYFSDGKSLNATFWLTKPFKENPTSFAEVDYGMFIDSDFNSKTGFGGIDYKVEIGWKNDTKSWTKTIEKWSRYDNNERTVKIYPNYTDFYEKGHSFVSVSADLAELLNPDRYKIVFYGDSRKSNGDLIIDYTRWVAIPPLELAASTYPSSIELTQGEKKSVEINVNATEGYTPVLNLSANILDKEITPNFKFKNISIPSYGFVSIPMTIYATKDAATGPTTLLIFANSNFPPEELLKIAGTQPVSPYNVNSKSSIGLLIKEPPNWMEQLGYTWDKIGGFTNFIYGIIAGLSPFIYMQLRKKFSNNQN